MNPFHGSALCALVAIAALWLVLIWLGARLRIKNRSRGIKAAFGATTILLVFIPLDGVPLWNRAFSFYPNPSLPMLGMACAALWQRLFGIAVFKPSDWKATWIFGAIAGSVLYLHPMILGSLDLYYWGWERVAAAFVLATIAIAFIAYGNRFGVLCLAALIAYSLNALESQNCWDYIVDPFYWLVSLGILASRGIAAVVRQLGAKRKLRRIPTPLMPEESFLAK